MALKKLYIEVSSACNLNCKMCFRNGWFNETPILMDAATLEKVKENIISCQAETVFFGGMGEPLMHKSIFDLICTAKCVGKTVELITNATLLNEEVSKKLATSCLDTLWISMDGFCEQIYENVRRGSLYREIMNNIRFFNSVRKDVKLGFTFVLMKENQEQLQIINDFADSMNADLINVSHVIPGGQLKKEDALYNGDFSIGKMHRLPKNPLPKLPENLCPFIADDACFIRADGEVCACMQLLHNSYTYFYEEKRKVFAHSFGNICNTPLYDIYNSSEYKKFRTRVRNFEFPCCTLCLGCEDRLENLTDCMYNKSPTCGACLWAQGYIRCP